MRIIKNGRIIENTWRHLGDDEDIDTGPCTVSWNRWRREREDLLGRRPAPLGVRLGAGDPADELAADLTYLSLIVLEFASLRDGRSFSQAQLLRERYGYTGEIRAKGDFIRDQIFFLSRVGVDAFELTDEGALAGALTALNDFSVTYQLAAGDSARAEHEISRAVRPRY